VNGCPHFPKLKDVPLIASPGINRRSEIAAISGCDPDKKWILLSFTTLSWNDDSLASVEGIVDFEFFTVRPLAWKRRNIHPLDRDQVTFSDVIASVDAVISKPGFGILSDCIVNGKPLIYADRSDFLEYAILEDAIKKYLKHFHIPSSDLYRGDLLKKPEKASGNVHRLRKLLGWAEILWLPAGLLKWLKQKIDREAEDEIL